MKHLLRHAVFGLSAMLPLVALAQQNGISIGDAWSRPAMQGRTGVVYLTITDQGAADRLTSIASPVAAKAELHESFSEHGVAKMRAIPDLPVTSGVPVTLAPGGYHIMLMDLKQALKAGDNFPVTLRFERAGPIAATVTVRPMGGGANTDHGGMGGMHMPGKSP